MKGEWKYHHIGYVVRNVDKMVESYKLIGFKPLTPVSERVWAVEDLTRWQIYGKKLTAPIGLRMCTLRKDSFLIEVHQPIKGDSIQKEFLVKHGEGIYHIHFSVDDVEKEVATLAKHGFQAVQTVVKPEGGGLMEAFIDTTQIGNVMIALWQGPFSWG